MRYHFTRKSSNVKTGRIPVTTTERASCPPSCPFRDNGCYADGGPIRLHWDAIERGERGTDLDGLCRELESLPDSQLWRHNQAGDLPGEGDTIDRKALRRITAAAAHTRGFTYTHKPANKRNLQSIREALEAGFVINLSANSLEHADVLAESAPGVPLVAVVPSTESKAGRTPAGRGRSVPQPIGMVFRVRRANCARILGARLLSSSQCTGAERKRPRPLPKLRARGLEASRTGPDSRELRAFYLRHAFQVIGAPTRWR